MIVAALSALLGLASLTQAGDDPLAPARQGMMRCYDPDRAAKTCRHTIRYLFQPDGRIVGDEVVTMQETPRIVMHMQATETVVDGMVCEKFVPEDYRTARFTIDGVEVPDEELEDWQGAAIDVNVVRPGQTMCLRSQLVGDVYRNQGFVDGKPMGPADWTWIWVDPAEGWRVPGAPGA